MPAPDRLEETYSREPGRDRRRYRGRMEICRVCHGVLGTASAPFLEQTMGGLDHTRALQWVPRTAAEGGCPPQVHSWVRIST